MTNPSGQKTWTLDVDEIILEAKDNLGGKFSSSEDAVSAMRSLNLVFKDLMNRGIPMFTVERKSFAVSASTASYTLPSGVVHVLDAVMSVSGTDYPMNRIGFLEWNKISNKDTLGRPTMYTTETQRDNVLVRVWPTPDDDEVRTINYYAVEDPDDITKLFQGMDIHRRYMPVLVAGLTYFLAKKMGPAYPTDRINMFRAEYMEQIEMIRGDDRERTSLIVTPASYTMYQR